MTRIDLSKPIPDLQEVQARFFCQGGVTRMLDGTVRGKLMYENYFVLDAAHAESLVLKKYPDATHITVTDDWNEFLVRTVISLSLPDSR